MKKPSKEDTEDTGLNFNELVEDMDVEEIAPECHCEFSRRPSKHLKACPYFQFHQRKRVR